MKHNHFAYKVLLVSFTCSLLLAGCRPKFQEYKSENCKFSIQMPEGAFIGDSAGSALFLASVGDTLYAAHCEEYSGDDDLPALTATYFALDIFKNQTTSANVAFVKSHMKFESTTYISYTAGKIELPCGPASPIMAIQPDPAGLDKCVGNAYLIEDHIYFIYVRIKQGKDAPNEEDVSKFLDSFQYNP